MIPVLLAVSVLLSEAIVQNPKGEIHQDGSDEFEEVFELSEAGKPFETYSRARFKRVK